MKKWAAEVVREQLGIPGCRSVIRLDKEIRREGEEPSLETRYFVSSLNPDVVSAKEFQAYIRGHWEVENCLHMLKDRDGSEDKHACGADSVRRQVPNIGKMGKTEKILSKSKRLKFRDFSQLESFCLHCITPTNTPV